jgi:hypothetical protein
MAYNSNSVARGTVKGDTPFSQRSNTLNRRDLLIYVTNYDLERHLICGNHVQDGRYMEISVDPQEVARGREQEQRNPQKTAEAAYLGHSIDARMKERIVPDGAHIAIVEGAEVTKKINKTVNGQPQEIRLVRCRRISDGGVNPKKTFEALVTLTKNSRFNSVDRVQCWSAEATDVTNEEAVAALAARFDKVSNAHRNAQAEIQDGGKGTSYLPIIGVELRTVRMSDNPAEGGRIVDLSGRMERTRAEYDPSTNTLISPSVPIDGAVFKQNLEAYTKYVKETYGENVRIEMSTYTSYPTGRYNNDFDFNEMRSGYSPFLQMASARSKVAADDDAFVEGGNYGGWGVVSISKDKTDDAGTVIPRHYVNRVYVSSNAKSFVHRKIKSADGQAYDLEDGLKGDVLRWKDTQKTPAQNTVPSRAPQAPAARPAASAPSFDGGDDFSGGDAGHDDIPFESLSSTRPTAPATPAASNFAPASTAGRSVAPGWEDDDDIPFDDTPPPVVSRPRP